MRTLKTSEAAALLNVSPSTLRAWEHRFGFPKPERSPGRHRLYLHAEIAALGVAIERGLSISSAVSVAARSVRSEEHALAGALASFRSEQADRAMESALALRTLEAALDQVLLPTLDVIRERHGESGAAWAFAAVWTADWLRRAQRLSPPATSGRSVLIGDASAGPLDADAPYVRALELCLARAGVDVLCLPVAAAHGLCEAIAARSPHEIVLAGGDVTDRRVGRWAYAARAAARDVPVKLYRCGRSNAALPASPLAAAHALTL